LKEKTKRGVCSSQCVEARAEVKNFLKALNSYPARFARDPGLSFEDYIFAVVEGTKSAQGKAGLEAGVAAVAGN
jgi:hypothetical protein